MKSTEDYSLLLSGYLQLEKRLIQKRIENYRYILSAFTELQTTLQNERRENPPFFTPLTFFKIDEITYSKFLAWCFNPNESHCQGDLLFKGFINHFNFRFPLRSMEYTVQTEFVEMCIRDRCMWMLC